MYDVTALGELLIDFTPAGVNDQGCLLFARNAGGAPANVLAANARLGGRTAFIGKVGDDPMGGFLRKTLEDLGIDTRGLAASPDVNTTLAFVELGEGGERTFGFFRKPGADTCLTFEEVDLSLVREAAIFHFGSLSLTHEPARSATLRTAAKARAWGKIVSFDPNWRPPLWESAEAAVEQMMAGLAYADIVKVSEEEMALLTGQEDLETGSRLLAKDGAALILISLGERGCFYRRGQDTGHVPAYRVEAVDTTGAGDAFLGAVHHGLRQSTLSDLRSMPLPELQRLLRTANAAGALTTTRKGGIPALPTRAEIEDLQQI